MRYLGSVIVEMGHIIRRLERKVNTLEDQVDSSAGAAEAPAPPPAVPRGPCTAGKGKAPATASAPAATTSTALPFCPVPAATAGVVRPSDILVLAPAPVVSSWCSVAKAPGGEKSFTVV